MRFWISRWALLGALTACEPQGVPVGTEELCVLPLQLARASTDEEALSPCSEIGENLLENANFEAPSVSECQSTDYCHFPAASVRGWQTTSPAQGIEIWAEHHRGVDAPQGSQFVELDATSRDTLFQDLELAPGTLMYWSLLHRGRLGLERMDLRIGPPRATQSQALIESTVDGWHVYNGLYRVGLDELETRFELVSLSGVTEGNLVDAVSFAQVR